MPQPWLPMNCTQTPPPHSEVWTHVWQPPAKTSKENRTTATAQTASRVLIGVPLEGGYGGSTTSKATTLSSNERSANWRVELRVTSSRYEPLGRPVTSSHWHSRFTP